MWSRIGVPKTMKVTRALIEEFVSMEPLPRDRPISEKRLQVYRRILAAGEFRPVTWASVRCNETDCTYRVNGKHTSMVLAEQSAVPDNFFVTVERYICQTLEDAARLYATFDSTISSRTSRDIVHSFASTVPVFAGMPQKVFQLAVTAICYDRWGIGQYQRTAAERAEQILDEIDFVIWLNGILFGHGGEKTRASHLLRTPVSSAMFASWKRDEADATTFWESVRDETDTDRDAPSRKLARFLGSRSVKDIKSVASVSFREMYGKCIHGWNAFRKRTSTDLKYYPSAKDPVAV